MRRFGFIIGALSVALVLGAAAVRPAVAQPKTITDCSTCPDMVVVPTGQFSMGTDPNALELDHKGRGKAEAGVVKMSINQSFALGRTEITRAQYAAFVKATGYNPDIKFCRVWDQAGARFVDVPKRDWQNTGMQTPARDDHPVTCVSWDDAVAYTQWLSTETGKTYRLPSEAEWEYAARAGSAKKRFWGDDPAEGCAYANTYDLTSRRTYPLSWTHVMCADGFTDLAPVASLLPNNFGLHDMIGNVWEWVGDCFTTSKVGRPKDQRAWTWPGCTERALRGGSWMTAPDRSRVAFPAGDPPSDRYVFLGFRVARELAAGEN
ncbi:MAG: formylglycine-generating enzyme family protein [Rhodospirillaceae bacterium]|nr:formylglycine-generating enzyme family protein [Rhodospirillaceae bacterium]